MTFKDRLHKCDSTNNAIAWTTKSTPPPPQSDLCLRMCLCIKYINNNAIRLIQPLSFYDQNKCEYYSNAFESYALTLSLLFPMVQINKDPKNLNRNFSHSHSHTQIRRPCHSVLVLLKTFRQKWEQLKAKMCTSKTYTPLHPSLPPFPAIWKRTSTQIASINQCYWNGRRCWSADNRNRFRLNFQHFIL